MTTRFCTRSLLIVVAQASARRSRRIGPDKHSSPPTNDPPIGFSGKEHNDAASVASEVTSHSFDNDSSVDIVGERRADRCESGLASGGSIENRDQNHKIDPSTGAASTCRYWHFHERRAFRNAEIPASCQATAAPPSVAKNFRRPMWLAI
jgi:hypothetical protein